MAAGICLALLLGPLGAVPVRAELPPRPVKVAAVVTRDVPVFLEGNGSLKASTEVSVRPQVSGSLAEVHFREGDYVSKGAPLFSIDSKVYRARLDKAEAAVTVLETQLQETRNKVRRLKVLAKGDFVSRQDLEDAKSMAAVLKAQLKEARADVKLARIDLDYCLIRAPISGRAGLIRFKPGSLVAAGQEEPLVAISKLDPIYVDFNLPGKHLPLVKKRLAGGGLEVRISPRGSKGWPRTGKLTFLDNAIDPASGTFLLRGELPNGDRALWPGQFVRVRLILGRLSDAVLIPTLALQMDEKGYYVFVIDAENKAEYRPVTPGERYGSETVITSGLKPGERVVTVGQLGLRPGGRVVVLPAGAAGKEAEKK